MRAVARSKEAQGSSGSSLTPRSGASSTGVRTQARLEPNFLSLASTGPGRWPPPTPGPTRGKCFAPGPVLCTSDIALLPRLERTCLPMRSGFSLLELLRGPSQRLPVSQEFCRRRSDRRWPWQPAPDTGVAKAEPCASLRKDPAGHHHGPGSDFGDLPRHDAPLDDAAIAGVAQGAKHATQPSTVLPRDEETSLNLSIPRGSVHVPLHLSSKCA